MTFETVIIYRFKSYDIWYMYDSGNNVIGFEYSQLSEIDETFKNHKNLLWKEPAGRCDRSAWCQRSRNRFIYLWCMGKCHHRYRKEFLLWRIWGSLWVKSCIVQRILLWRKLHRYWKRYKSLLSAEQILRCRGGKNFWGEIWWKRYMNKYHKHVCITSEIQDNAYDELMNWLESKCDSFSFCLPHFWKKL